MYKKILLVATLAAGIASCSGDYTDWVQPTQNTQQATQKLEMAVSEVATQTIDVAALEGDSLEVVKFTVSDNMTITDAKLVLANEDKTEYSIPVAGNGKVAVAELQQAVVRLYNPAPKDRTLTGYVTATGVTKATAVQTTSLYSPLKSGEIKLVVKPEAPVLETSYYLIGTLNEWKFDHADSKAYEFTNGGQDPYDNPVFTCTIPAADVENGENWFKIAPASAFTLGNPWDAQMVGATVDGQSELEGDLTIGGGAQAWKIDQLANPGAKYKITLNLLEGTYKIEPQKAIPDPIYMPGNANGWNHNVCPVLAWDADKEALCGYAYMDGEFKFTPNADWSGEYNGNSFDQDKCSNNIVLNGGGNIGFEGQPGMYYLEVNLENRSFTAKATPWFLVGDFNGWSAADPAQEMKYNTAEHCMEFTNATVTANGWKFVVDSGWKTNLGGDLSDLQYNGDNISVVGTTIRLYLERTKDTVNDFKFHATVE